MTTIFTHCIVVISCHQYMKVGDLLAMTAMTLLDDSQNWGHFWKIKSIHGTYQYPTYAILNLCFHYDAACSCMSSNPCGLTKVFNWWGGVRSTQQQS
jgi:hypothetical protein